MVRKTPDVATPRNPDSTLHWEGWASWPIDDVPGLHRKSSTAVSRDRSALPVSRPADLRVPWVWCDLDWLSQRLGIERAIVNQTVDDAKLHRKTPLDESLVKVLQAEAYNAVPLPLATGSLRSLPSWADCPGPTIRFGAYIRKPPRRPGSDASKRTAYSIVEHEKLESVRHEKLIMVQRNKLIIGQRNKLASGQRERLG